MTYLWNVLHWGNLHHKAECTKTLISFKVWHCLKEFDQRARVLDPPIPTLNILYRRILIAEGVSLHIGLSHHDDTSRLPTIQLLGPDKKVKEVRINIFRTVVRTVQLWSEYPMPNIWIYVTPLPLFLESNFHRTLNNLNAEYFNINSPYLIEFNGKRAMKL